MSSRRMSKERPKKKEKKKRYSVPTKWFLMLLLQATFARDISIIKVSLAMQLFTRNVTTVHFVYTKFKFFSHI